MFPGSFAGPGYLVHATHGFVQRVEWLHVIVHLTVQQITEGAPGGNNELERYISYTCILRSALIPGHSGQVDAPPYPWWLQDLGGSGQLGNIVSSLYFIQLK